MADCLGVFGLRLRESAFIACAWRQPAKPETLRRSFCSFSEVKFAVFASSEEDRVGRAASRSELRSVTRAAISRAAVENRGSSLSSSPYWAITAEQPDAAEMIESAPLELIASTFARANWRARTRLPWWMSKAPQHTVLASCLT